ncbi:hypothetical protein CNX65_24110 [Actinosynnema pretiosum]|uniref:Uncharacterized protein n=2 Tax=Actinosynnema pretiosum TaxID=42197 RepID=A0A290ZAE8_9PSEU|nr:hypothetical protein CNX65_24110 [Actinosynnema pretiosum]
MTRTRNTAVTRSDSKVIPGPRAAEVPMNARPSEPRHWQAAAEPSDYYTGGPTWASDPAGHALLRINRAGGPAEATAQAAAEAVLVLHSIRRILLWTAVLLPLAVVLGALLLSMEPTR